MGFYGGKSSICLYIEIAFQGQNWYNKAISLHFKSAFRSITSILLVVLAFSDLVQKG